MWAQMKGVVMIFVGRRPKSFASFAMGYHPPYHSNVRWLHSEQGNVNDEQAGSWTNFLVQPFRPAKKRSYICLVHQTSPNL